MREHDDLVGLRHCCESTCESIYSGRIHRLHWIIDHDEAERTLGKRRPRQEQTEGQRVQLALTHDTECGSPDAVDGHVERDMARRPRAGKFDAPEFDIAVLPKK